MSDSPALQQALRLREQPDLLTGLQRAPLPPDMTGLIRIVTGESAATDAERSAAACFLVQVCLHAGADPRRCLALQAHDDLVTARTHHRLLIKWLHPDRNPGTKDLAERVNSAWTALKNPQPMMPSTVLDIFVPAANRSRFPLFLGSILLGASALLVVSVVPDAPVYMDNAEQAKSADVPVAKAALAMASVALPPSHVEVVAPAKNSSAPATATARKVALPAPVAMTASAKRMPPVVVPVALPEKPAVSAPKPIVLTPRALPSMVPIPFARASVADAISAVEAEALLQQFSAYYNAGNLQGLMALFSPKAISLKGGREAIAAEYSRQFSNTRQRRIVLNNSRWQAVDDARRLRAGFQVEQAFIGLRAPQKRSGNLEILVVRENGNPRILELLITE